MKHQWPCRVMQAVPAGGTPTGQDARIAGSAFHARTGLPLGARGGLQPAFVDPPAHGMGRRFLVTKTVRESCVTGSCSVVHSGAELAPGVTANLLKPHNS